jgi:bacterioferritin-associated ferredoxin
MGRTRCDCRSLSFLALRSYARRHGIKSVSELIRRTGCCTGCGTCRVHLEDFLRTGEVQVGDQRIRLPDVDLGGEAEDPRLK